MSHEAVSKFSVVFSRTFCPFRTNWHRVFDFSKVKIVADMNIGTRDDTGLKFLKT